MIEGLVWIIVLYGSAIVTVHLIHRVSQGRTKARSHYILWVKDKQLQMEWILRSIQMWHWMRGRQFIVTIVSEDASRETMDIAAKLLHRWGIEHRMIQPELALVETLMREDEHTVEIHLEPVEDLKRLQLFY
ncbi:hypothetical protein [Marinicrinis lubricantis]|uniref:Uncharacterized protein n=1 Tax=Marinicrinis lubricantis TaxID=2086470 RepID=A0ABW1IT41_9BACL